MQKPSEQRIQQQNNTLSSARRRKLLASTDFYGGVIKACLYTFTTQQKRYAPHSCRSWHLWTHYISTTSKGSIHNPRSCLSIDPKIQTGSLLGTEVVTRPSSFTACPHCMHRCSRHDWRWQADSCRNVILSAAIPRFPHFGICENL